MILFYRRYRKIETCEQRLQYKKDFTHQYKEYRKLHTQVNNVSSRFAELRQSIEKYTEDSVEFQV